MNIFLSIPPSFAGRTRLWFAVICLASAPIEAIDVLGDTKSFHLTPFLLLSMLYALFLAVEQVTKRALGLSLPRFRLFDSTSAAVALFILLIWTSVLFVSSDPRDVSVNRAIYSTWLILFARIFVAREELLLPIIIARALRIFLVCDVIGVATQLLIVLSQWTLPGIVYGLAVRQVGNVLRPGGLVIDPNRSSVTIILFMGLAFFSKDYLRKANRVGRGYYVLGSILTLVTISRTGVVALAIFAAIPFMRSRRKLKVLCAALLALIVLGGISIIYLQSTRTPGAIAEEAQNAVFSSDQRQASTSVHFQSIASGLGEFFGNTKIFLIGAGWGTEYDFPFIKETYDVGVGSGFDCQFVSIAVQTGIAGLACMLFLIAKPLLLGLEWRPLTFIVLWSCFFYQYHGDPFWWIAIITMTMPLASRLRDHGISAAASSWSSPIASTALIGEKSIEGA